MGRNSRPSWNTGRKVRKKCRPSNLPKHTDIFQTGGQYNSRRIHNEAVSSFIFMALGDEAWGPPRGSLSSVLEQVSAQHNIKPFTLRCWYNHFLKYGETVPETKLWEKQGYVRTKYSLPSEWNNMYANMLYELATEQPWLFLHKIQTKQLTTTGKLWSTSYIHKMLEHQGLSLQVVSYTAKQRSEEDRAAYKDTLESLVLFH
jgi:hypothetical protein